MFETYNFSKTLQEEVFDEWLEKGRNSKVGFNYLLITWDAWEEEFKPKYMESREALLSYAQYPSATEVMVAAYDLYSESKISFE